MVMEPDPLVHRAPPGQPVPLGLTMKEATQRYVQATVDACAGSQSEAARRLGIGRNTVARLLSSE